LFPLFLLKVGKFFFLIIISEFAVVTVEGTSNDLNVAGTVRFLTVGNMVNVTVSVTGITQNQGVPHGIHIHQVSSRASNFF